MRTTRYLVPALLALTGLASAQDLGALSSCAQNCINNMRTSVGCVPVTDQCLCGNANFENGIRDCATQSCTAEDVTAAMGYAGAFCLAATGTTTTAAAPETTNTTPPPPTTTSESETTSAPETTPTPTIASEPTSASAETATSESSTASAATTETSSTASSTASGATETSSATSASGTTSETTPGSKTSATQSASSTAGAAAAAPSNSGLSIGAKAGIAVGAGAAAVALVAFAIALCRTRRARRPLPRGTMQISEPLPGSGRLDYKDPAQLPLRPPKSAGSKVSQMTELDTNARRYEDMLPRVSPRRMV